MLRSSLNASDRDTVKSQQVSFSLVFEQRADVDTCCRFHIFLALHGISHAATLLSFFCINDYFGKRILYKLFLMPSVSRVLQWSRHLQITPPTNTHNADTLGMTALSRDAHSTELVCWSQLGKSLLSKEPIMLTHLNCIVVTRNI
jgi:hypothetical protein